MSLGKTKSKGEDVQITSVLTLTFMALIPYSTSASTGKACLFINLRNSFDRITYIYKCFNFIFYSKKCRITLVIIFAEDENVDIDAPHDLTQDVQNLGKVYNVLSIFLQISE